MAKGRTTQWIDPNGERHTRTSLTKVYTHLIVVKRDERLYAMDQLTIAYALEERAQAIRDLIEDPAPPEQKYPSRLHRYRPPQATSWYVRSVLWRDRDVADRDAWDTSTPRYVLPDWQHPAWSMYIEQALTRMDWNALAARTEAQAAIDSRREYRYECHGWSQSAANAEKKRRQVEKYQHHRYYEVFVADAEEV